eukprot:GFYU01000326.1.p1 GENE.GFYU01000326.1~~GFYU01000326.1.p1  ORF type:complete len:422 (-),score=82.50 GFYU01000326.1:551-1816(-)
MTKRLLSLATVLASLLCAPESVSATLAHPNESSAHHDQKLSLVEDEAMALSANPDATETVNLTVYLMSLCPDAAQFMETLSKVYELAAPIMNIKFEFIGHKTNWGAWASLHGYNEIRGNMLIACAQNIDNTGRYVAYAKCLMDDPVDVPFNGPHCAAEVGLDWQELDTCMRSHAGRSLFDHSANKANNLGVKWSPTIFLNGSAYCKYNDDYEPCPTSSMAWLRQICDLHSGFFDGCSSVRPISHTEHNHSGIHTLSNDDSSSDSSSDNSNDQHQDGEIHPYAIDYIDEHDGHTFVHQRIDDTQVLEQEKEMVEQDHKDFKGCCSVSSDKGEDVCKLDDVRECVCHHDYVCCRWLWDSACVSYTKACGIDCDAQVYSDSPLEEAAFDMKHIHRRGEYQKNSAAALGASAAVVALSAVLALFV